MHVISSFSPSKVKKYCLHSVFADNEFNYDEYDVYYDDDNKEEEEVERAAICDGEDDKYFIPFSLELIIVFECFYSEFKIQICLIDKIKSHDLI